MWNALPEVRVFSKDLDPNLGHQLIPLISTSSTGEGEQISDISWCSVWLEWNHTYPRSSSAHDCPAVLYFNQQWELNRFVNFPGDSLCLDDLVVESGRIRFAQRQSIHSFRALLSSEITSEARCVDNANLISNKQICPIFNNTGTPPNLKDKHRFGKCQPLV